MMTRNHRSVRTALLLAVLAVPAVFGLGIATAHAQSILVNHTTVDASGIPLSALDDARALRMTFSHASVGSNIWDSGLVPLRNANSRRYSFPNWTENPRGNPTWQEKLSAFATWVDDHASQYDVFMNKLCYIDQAASFTAYRDSMLAIASAHPTKKIVWWTMPLRIDGSDNGLRQAYNESVRAYCAANDLPLFDIAAIESHRPDGSAVTVGGYEALASEYASDSEGHLNAAGSARMANAFWYLMARLSGFSPNGNGGTADSGTVTPPSSGSSGCAACTPGSAGATAGLAFAAAVSVFALWRRR